MDRLGESPPEMKKTSVASSASNVPISVAAAFENGSQILAYQILVIDRKNNY